MYLPGVQSRLLYALNEIEEAQNRPLKVSFDFDNTLAKLDLSIASAYDSILKPNEAVIKKFRAHEAHGDTIYVVTARADLSDNKRDIRSFLAQHNLKVRGIYFTSGIPKAEILRKLDIDMHYDDNPEELEAIAQIPEIEGINSTTLAEIQTRTEDTETPGTPGYMFFQYLSKLRKLYGLSGTPEFLGSGTQGSAYRMNDKVVKATLDKSEAESAASLLARNVVHPNIYRIHGVARAPAHARYGHSIYFIVYDYLQSSMPEEAQTIIDFSRGTWPASTAPVVKQWKQENFEEIAQILKQGVDPATTKLRSLYYFIRSLALQCDSGNIKTFAQFMNFVRSRFFYYIDGLMQGLAALAKARIFYDDLWGPNIMYNSETDQLVIIDIGYSTSPQSSGIIKILEQEERAFLSEIRQLSLPGVRKAKQQALPGFTGMSQDIPVDKEPEEPDVLSPHGSPGELQGIKTSARDREKEAFRRLAQGEKLPFAPSPEEEPEEEYEELESRSALADLYPEEEYEEDETPTRAYRKAGAEESLWPFLPEDINRLRYFLGDLVKVLHSKEFDKVLSWAKTDNTNFEKLGAGSYGVAYKIANDRVLKITFDIREAKSAATVAALKLASPHVYHIEGVATFKRMLAGMRKMPFFIVYPYYYNLDRDEARDVDRFNNEFWRIKNEEGRTGLKDWLADIVSDYEDNYEEDDPANPHYSKIGYDLAKGSLALLDAGIMAPDCHSENVLKDAEGNFVLADLGVSESPPGSEEHIQQIQEASDIIEERFLKL
jgi:hypothetical protein